MKSSEWIDKFGKSRIQALAQRLGGQRVYIPAEGPLHTDLQLALGNQAEELRFYAGTRIEIPRFSSVRGEIMRREAVCNARSLLSTGLSVRAVSQATGLSRPTVAKLRAAAG